MARVDSIFRKLDWDETVANVDALLATYIHYKAIAGRDGGSLQSPAMDGMPKSPSVDNRVEAKLVGELSAHAFVDQCDHCLARVQDDTFNKILKLTYFVYMRPTDDAIMERVGLAHSAYYEAKRKAQMAFAENWPPAGTSDLLVYK